MITHHFVSEQQSWGEEEALLSLLYFNCSCFRFMRQQQQIYRSVQYINCCFREGSEALGVIAHVTLAYVDTIKMWWQRL
jgi:hypothetical protein